MTIAFYMNEHVYRAITNGLKLRNNNVDVLTVQEDDRTGISDEMVLARSIALKGLYLLKMMIFC